MMAPSIPEGWLSVAGQMAQQSPEYSPSELLQLSRFEVIFCSHQRVIIWRLHSITLPLRMVPSRVLRNFIRKEPRDAPRLFPVTTTGLATTYVTFCQHSHKWGYLYVTPPHSAEPFYIIYRSTSTSSYTRIALRQKIFSISPVVKPTADSASASFCISPAPFNSN